MLYSMPMASARVTKLRSTVACSNGPGSAFKQIVAGARPAELGDHDALAGKLFAQELVAIDRLIDRLLARRSFPSKAGRGRR